MRKSKKTRPTIWAAIAFLAALLFILIFADTLSIHDPTNIDLNNALLKSNHEYPFGTDEYGRCVFCRCLLAVRNSIGIAFTIEFVSVFIGMLLGTTAAYFGGILDGIFNSVSNALMAFPKVILIMLIIAFLSASTENIIIAMLIVDWIWYARISRSLTLSLKEQKYVQAARLNGANSITILRRHIIPGILPQLTGQFTLALGNVILSLAGFSFLGLGIQRPMPELGIMISDGCNLIRTNSSVLFWPSLILFLIVLDFNILGEWISECLRRQY